MWPLIPIIGAYLFISFPLQILDNFNTCKKEANQTKGPLCVEVCK